MLSTLDGSNLDSSMTEGEQGRKKVIGSKGRFTEMNEHQGMKSLLPEAITDCEDKAVIDNDESTRCVSNIISFGRDFCNFNSMSNFICSL